MYDDERKMSILNTIQARGSVNVANLAKKYSVSESTIRRDLSSLEKSGFVKRTHGGAIPIESSLTEYDYNAKKTLHSKEKEIIAKKVANMIKNNSTIFLGTSTATNILSCYLTAKGLTIVTNSLDVANIISKRSDYNLIILGGNYINTARTIEGMTSINQIQQMHFNQAFLGANGIDVNFGISTTSDLEARSKFAVSQNSSEGYYLCDASKFDRISQYKVSNLSEITAIVTDPSISTDIKEKYDKHCNIII